MSLLDQYGKPIKTMRRTARASRDSGAFRGASFSEWFGPQTYSDAQEANERMASQRRAADLSANDWAAHAAVEAIDFNAIGTGLRVSANIPAKQLGISREEARAIGEQMEWAFYTWMEEADIRGFLHFYDLQLLGLQQVLSLGEMIHIPVMLSEDRRKKYNMEYALHLQTVSPSRLFTPSELALEPHIIDGIKTSEFGRPESYYILSPSADYKETFALPNSLNALPLSEFTEIRAQIGHRKGIFHLFRHETDEQYRGVSIFSKSMGLFRNLDEVIKYELIAQVMAACFPVFVSMENNASMPDFIKDERGIEDTPRSLYHEVQEGQIYYGAEGEKPHVLESKRPSANFASFVDIVTRSISASVGIPFESLTKDFSKTNYSSARAALNEAWKLYNFYRQWFVRLYCQPIYEMVIEEAYLRGYIKIPSHLNFYALRKLWTNANWIGPSRGSIDPVKEVNATILKLNNKLMTYREAWEELGGNFEDSYDQMLSEHEQVQKLREIENVTERASETASEPATKTSTL